MPMEEVYTIHVINRCHDHENSMLPLTHAIQSAIF